MLIDNSLILDDSLILTTTGSSTNYIDTVGAAGGQAQISGVNTIQGGNDAYESLFWEVDILTAVTGGNIDFQLWTSEVVANIWTTGNGGSLPTAVAVTTIKLLDSGVVLAASLTKGAVILKGRIPGGCQRYISAFYTCVGTFSGGGTLSALIMPDVDINLT